jgi:fructokinase
MNRNIPTTHRPLLIGLGEVLWDLLPAGKQLGGAPANFASHGHALGAEALVVSRIGNDALGREILDRLCALGLRTDGLTTDPAAPTGTVSVALDAQGQPTFTIHENAAWDFLEAGPGLLAEAARADAICFGTLGQRNPAARAAIRALVAAAPANALRILDVNLRQHYFSGRLIEESLALANVLKVNDTELPRLAEMLLLTGDDRSQIGQLAGRYGLRLVAYTRGSRGSLLFSNGLWSDHPGNQTKVVDTVGAGDAFTATMTLGLLAGWNLDEINARANAVAAYVCSQPGATPALPDHLRARFRLS